MISVIIPMYNAEMYIEECIESVLNQGEDIEIILVDDGSTDRTKERVAGYCAHNSNIRYFFRNNSGVSEARNYGIEYVAGEYVVFVDADDTLPANALVTLRNAIENKQVDAVFGNHNYLYDGKVVERIPRLEKGQYQFADLQTTLVDDGTLTGILFGSVCGAIYKSSFIRENSLKFDCDIKRNEDGLFNLSYITHSKYVYVIEEPVYNYRQWKKKKTTELVFDMELRKVDEKIKDMFNGVIVDEYLNVQLQCRMVSITFWDSLKIDGYNIKYSDAKKYLKKLFSNNEFKRNIQMLNHRKINKYKKILLFLASKEQYFLYYLAIHYFYPVLSGIIKR